MSQRLFTRPGLVALSTAVISSMGVLIGTPANGGTFKGIIYKTDFPAFENSEIEYTLADGIFESIISSPPNTFFIDGDYTFGPEPTLPMRLATLVPEVVTKFKWTTDETYTVGDPVTVVDIQLSIFGITDEGLFLQVLDVSQPPIYQNIFMSTIQAPEGLPLSACKTQACDASADFGGKGGFYGSRMIVTPVTEPESVPEPSAAVALSVVGVLFLKRPRKAVSIPAVVTADSE
jgi:hypothetical protein